MAHAAAIASTRLKEKGNWICSDKDASTYPFSFRITTPKPTLLMSLKSSTSKLILREFVGGGIQVTRFVLNTVAGDCWALFAHWKTDRACRAIETTWVMG